MPLDYPDNYPGRVANPEAQNAPPFPAGVNAGEEDSPKSSRAWLEALDESEDVYRPWNDSCDRVDKLYSNLQHLSNHARDKEFQLFWANIAVVGPSIYQKCPIPVVVPKFKDRRPIFQVSSEVMERCATVAFDLMHIHDLLTLVRDDVTLPGRGVLWFRYESGKGQKPERVACDFKHRKDFLHSIARNWEEVSWVAAASYLTQAQMKRRFEETSGDAYLKAEYEIDKEMQELGGTDKEPRAKVWEIWNKSDASVCWVTKGVDVVLDDGDPHLVFDDFFPCPKPAYATLQRATLIPVPDVAYYKDQLDEVNLLTSRIHALSDSLEVKGFYPAGGAELADAVESAVRVKSPGRVLVPISNWASFGGTKDVIIWLPIDQIATTITALVMLRKQIIDDIYQIMGLADIMRGASDPQETLGAQQIKTQYGSVRIRDKQNNMAKLAADCVKLTVEIITEKFRPETILQMCQMQIPSQAMKAQQIAAVQTQGMLHERSMQRLAQHPGAQQVVQQNPQMAQQVTGQAQQMMAATQQQIMKLQAEPSVEDVMAFIHDNRARSFVLDIETDSTIQADENAEKQRRAEFLQMLAPLLQQLSMMIAAQPTTAPFCGEVLKFAVAPYRASRSLDTAIDDLVTQMVQQGETGGQNGQQNAQAMQTQLDQQKLQFEQQKLQADIADKEKDRQIRVAEAISNNQREQQKMQSEQQIAMMEAQGNHLERQARLAQIQAQMDRDAQTHQQNMSAMAAQQQNDIVAGQQKLQITREQAIARQQEAAERRAARVMAPMQPNTQTGQPLP